MYEEINCPECDGIGDLPNNNEKTYCKRIPCNKCGGEGYIVVKAGLKSLKDLKKLMDE
jgi:DnaJ-class molecular chaperone